MTITAPTYPSPVLTPPFPPGCGEFDFVGCSQVALVAFLDGDSITPEPFLRHMREYVRTTPVTHNQRQLLTAVLMRCLEGINYDAPAPTVVDDSPAALIARLTAGDNGHE